MVSYGTLGNSTTAKLFRFLVHRVLLAPLAIFLELQTNFELFLVLIGEIGRAFARFTLKSDKILLIWHIQQFIDYESNIIQHFPQVHITKTATIPFIAVVLTLR